MVYIWCVYVCVCVCTRVRAHALAAVKRMRKISELDSDDWSPGYIVKWQGEYLCCWCSVRPVVSDSVTPWTEARQASLSLTISQSWASSCPLHRWCYPAISSSGAIFENLLPSIFPSIRDFSSESAVCVRWPKYWSFNFSPSNEYSGLIYLKIDWFHLHAIQGTLRSLLQHHSSKASFLLCSAFYTVQLSQPCMTTGKTKALTIWTFVSIVMSLLFSTLFRFVIVFLPRSKCLLISWLQSPSAVFL